MYPRLRVFGRIVTPILLVFLLVLALYTAFEPYQKAAKRTAQRLAGSPSLEQHLTDLAKTSGALHSYLRPELPSDLSTALASLLGQKRRAFTLYASDLVLPGSKSVLVRTEQAVRSLEGISDSLVQAEEASALADELAELRRDPTAFGPERLAALYINVNATAEWLNRVAPALRQVSQATRTIADKPLLEKVAAVFVQPPLLLAPISEQLRPVGGFLASSAGLLDTLDTQVKQIDDDMVALRSLRAPYEEAEVADNGLWRLLITPVAQRAKRNLVVLLILTFLGACAWCVGELGVHAHSLHPPRPPAVPKLIFHYTDGQTPDAEKDLPDGKTIQIGTSLAATVRHHRAHCSVQVQPNAKVSLNQKLITGGRPLRRGDVLEVPGAQVVLV
jgi:hypothetical protein